MKKARATCPKCGKTMGVSPPYQGDGSADIYPRHNRGAKGLLDRSRCVWSRMVVRDDEYVERPQ